MKKRIKSKSTKAESSQSSVAVNQDIAGLLTTLVQKLTSFEIKLDTVLSRLPSQPSAVPQQRPAVIPSPEQRRESRPMYKVICADCNKSTEVPFKPSTGRPVYCKECFTKRKNNGTLKPRGDNKPKEEPVQVRPPENPKPIKPAAPIKKKKSAIKKKRN